MTDGRLEEFRAVKGCSAKVRGLEL